MWTPELLATDTEDRMLYWLSRAVRAEPIKRLRKLAHMKPINTFDVCCAVNRGTAGERQIWKKYRLLVMSVNGLLGIKERRGPQHLWELSFCNVMLFVA